jgi:hypothetical protein
MKNTFDQIIVGLFLALMAVGIVMLANSCSSLRAGAPGRAEIVLAPDGSRCYILFSGEQPVGGNCR